MKKRLSLLLTVAALFAFSSIMAQKTVTGTIIADDGTPLIGVNVLEDGTSNGTVTDLDGKYSLTVQEGAKLSFSLIGYETLTATVGAESVMNLTLREGVNLDEVVVTALGIEREKKALSYSVTEVDGSSLLEARAPNLVNALAGKVAGVNVSSTATGAAGSTRVVIRGNASLGGSNQPLYIVDGVMLNNDNLGAAGMWGGQDWGDGISSINPDDIESVSVLKGSSASALYGFRASNGAIIITTKSGKKRKGIGVEYSTQLRAESLIDLYDFQDQYGHGRLGAKPTTQEEAFANGLYAWGDQLDGSNVIQFDGVSRPYSSVGNNLDRFYRTGTSWVNTLALTGGNDMFTYRLSATNFDNKDIVPGSDMVRRNFNLRVDGNLSEKLSISAGLKYIIEDAKNRPRLSDSPGNANYTVWSLPASIDVETLRGTTDKAGANEDGTELQFNDNVFVTNPWWAARQFEANSNKNRLLGNFSARYDIWNGIYARGRLAYDRFDRRRRNLTPYGTAYSNFGQLEESNLTFQETNTELIVGFNKELNDKVGLHIFAGGNQLYQQIENLGGSGNNFNVPFLHALQNLANRSTIYTFEEQRVNSLFASAEISLLRSIYINGTARNDWFSTLTDREGNSDNDQLYYSAGASFVFSDLIDLPNWFDYGKVRVSFAQTSSTGEANRPYGLNLNYRTFAQGHLGNPLGGIANGSIPNSALVPLLVSEVEVGLDLRFLQNRVGIDFAWYDNTTTNDILNAAVSPTSGFGSKTVTVGEMRNTGVELLLTLVPIQTRDFDWEFSLNYANNQNEVVSLLTDENDEEFIRVGESRTRNAYIHHVEGLPYSQIAGFAYARNADGSIMLDDDGLPVQGEFTTFGTGVPPTSMGISNSFRYKNLSLRVLIDMRMGAKIYGATNAYGYFRGLHKATLEGRETGLGAVSAENIENYYQRIAFNITEEFIQDADFAKLREVVLTYRVPKSLYSKLGLADLTLGVAGRNLLLLWSETDNFDPESTYTNGNAQGLEMFGVPQTRSFQFNLGVKF
jgi:TonB-linked SusC/RagA family outer membrane protein